MPSNMYKSIFIPGNDGEVLELVVINPPKKKNKRYDKQYIKDLIEGNWDLDVDKHIKDFMNNRFWDNGPGKNDHPTRMDICGCQLKVVYYGFSGTYMFYINGITNGTKYQPSDYLIKKVIQAIKETAENEGKYQPIK